MSKVNKFKKEMEYITRHLITAFEDLSVEDIANKEVVGSCVIVEKAFQYLCGKYLTAQHTLKHHDQNKKAILQGFVNPIEKQFKKPPKVGGGQD